jgi:hypothetical protein
MIGAQGGVANEGYYEGPKEGDLSFELLSKRPYCFNRLDKVAKGKIGVWEDVRLNSGNSLCVRYCHIPTVRYGNTCNT